MKLLILALALSVGTTPEFSYSPEEVADMEAKLRKWRAYAEEAGSKPPEVAIERLGLGLRQTSRTSSYPFGDRIGARDELKKALLAIPGHADFFAKRLREAEAALERAKDSPERGGLIGNLTNQQQDTFQTLGMLPSVESVRVIGEFLFDEKGLVPKEDSNDSGEQKPQQHAWGFSPNSAYALQAIAKLPLVSPPVPTRKSNFVIYDEDIEAWRLWYEQVKSGKRTFRFEGDPQIYNLAGPVIEAREPKVERSSPSNKVPASTSNTEEKTTGLPIWPLTVGGVLLAVAIWFTTKRKPAAF